MNPAPPIPQTFTPDDSPSEQTSFPEEMLRMDAPLEGNRHERRLAAKQRRAKRPVKPR